MSVEAWGPFVFVNPDVEAAPLAGLLGELPGLLTAGGIELDSLRFLRRSHSAVRGELEGLLRELPRVLPLPYRPPRLLEGRRRPRSTHTSSLRAAGYLVPVRAGARGAHAARSTRAGPVARGRVPLCLAEPDDQRHARTARTSRSAPCCPPGRSADGALPRLLRRPGTSTRRGSPRMIALRRSRWARRTLCSSSACRRACEAAGSKHGHLMTRVGAARGALPGPRAGRPRLTGLRDRPLVNIW